MNTLSVFFIKVKIHWLSGKGIQNYKKLRLQLGEPCIFNIAYNLSQELLTQNGSHVELRVSGKCSEWSRYIYHIISLLETQGNLLVFVYFKNKWQNYWNQSWALLVLTSEQGKGTALKIIEGGGFNLFFHLDELLGRTVFAVVLQEKNWTMMVVTVVCSVPPWCLLSWFVVALMMLLL